MDEFDAPASGVKVTEFEGMLLLCKPTSFMEKIATSFGPADAVEMDVDVLDGAKAGQSHSAVRVFQKALIGQLRPKIGGKRVLGRLGKGQAKAGQSAPWVLLDPTDADKQAARDFLAKQTAAAGTPPF